MKIRNFINWLKFSILIFCLILILIGFLFGYIYYDDKNESCIGKPLFYGINKINEINNDEFTCSCTSMSGNINPFYFDESGIISETLFIESQEKYLIK